jgi:hypothetical protein
MLVSLLGCNELAFVFHPLPRVLPASVSRFIYAKIGKRGSGYLAHTRRALHVAAAVAIAMGAPALTGWFMLASAILWAGTLALIALAPLNITKNESAHMFNVVAALHIGALNWLVDVPGAHDSATHYTHLVTIAANIAAISAICLGLALAPGLARAWSCYPTIPVSGLTSGTCATNFNTCPGDATPCPDFAQPACALALSNSCGVRDLQSDTMSELEPFVTVGRMIAVASLCLYATAVFKRSATFVKGHLN